MVQIIAGVDEAGRGCIIGPLVLCIAASTLENGRQLKKLGVKDSKLLSPASRERLISNVKAISETVVVQVTAQELNEMMKTKSLNEIEAIKIAEGLALLKSEPEIIYIDSPDADPSMFEKRIRKYYSGKAKVVCENHADSNHTIVGAASIVAKVERDREIEKIKKIVGENFNSGYTSDEITMEFLKRRVNEEIVLQFVRIRWETFDRLKQRKLGEFGEEKENQ
ncbi:Ribonuclease HII [Candidatus Gugararchaeum adminiculabundum]|nr:Ribonuclease HII [Candidatus Gugararchaeum adminiculabundum]